VTFRTIHGAKGDEDDVVAVADLGASLGRFGPYLDRFLGHGSHVGLAPPSDIATPERYPALKGTVLAGEAYDPDASPGDDQAGLRWASERWVPGEARLAGPPPLRDAVADTRAERWRILFVALSRARDHLVLPLPERRERPTPRDRWVDTLRGAFDFDGAKPARYTVDTPGDHDPLAVRVHRTARPDSTGGDTVGSESDCSDDASPVATPSSLSVRGWTPRFVNPSTVYPLSAAPAEHVLDHLSGRALHADHDGVADAVPMAFENIGPDAVGDVFHDTFAAALSQEVATETLRNCDGPLPAALDRAIARHTRAAPAEECDQLRQYVARTLLPQVAKSALWDRLQESSQQYVEEPLDAVTRIGEPGVDVEVGGQADIISVDGDGRWRVDDVKVALNPLDEELRRRYDLQAATYAWALGRQPGVTEVAAAVTTVGVESGTRTVDVGESALQAALERLSDLRFGQQ
jgi:ATP-dependent helicase/nuclease subunit A